MHLQSPAENDDGAFLPRWRRIMGMLGALLTLAMVWLHVPAPAWAGKVSLQTMPPRPLARPTRPVAQQARIRIPPALVFDMKTGRVLLAHDAGRPWHPASLTKLMTAWLVFQAVETRRLSFNTERVISPAVVRGVERGAAKYGVKPGERMHIGRMLTFLMVRSDADMALALAEAVAGSERAFVNLMNHTARRLGMTGTHFVNCHGMHHPAQVTTARDMAVLARDIYVRFLRRHPDWWRFFSRKRVEKRIINARTRKPMTVRLKNRNRLLFMMPEAMGMKTGFICASGFNLLATARRGDVLLGAVVFGRRSAYNRASVARILLEEGFRRYRANAGWKRADLAISRLANSGGRAVDMSRRICRTHELPRVEPAAVRGWGVLLGPAVSARRAVALAEAELLAAELADARHVRYGVGPLSSGLLRMTELLDVWRKVRKARRGRPAPHGALIWNLDEAQARGICLRARAHRVPCVVRSPAALRALASIWPRPKAKRKRQARRRKQTWAGKSRAHVRHSAGRQAIRLH